MQGCIKRARGEIASPIVCLAGRLVNGGLPLAGCMHRPPATPPGRSEMHCKCRSVAGRFYRLQGQPPRGVDGGGGRSEARGTQPPHKHCLQGPEMRGATLMTPRVTKYVCFRGHAIELEGGKRSDGNMAVECSMACSHQANLGMQHAASRHQSCASVSPYQCQFPACMLSARLCNLHHSYTTRTVRCTLPRRPRRTVATMVRHCMHRSVQTSSTPQIRAVASL